jgi:hypothetical protein
MDLITGGQLMPVDLMLVAASAFVMFVAFAAVLAWGDLQTRPRQLAQRPSVKRRAF